MKYIDAEKLKILVKRQIRLENLNFAALGGGGQTFCINTLEWVLKQIDSLQQEQPEVDLEKEFNDFLEKQNACVNDDDVISYYNDSSFNHTYDIYPIARHFYELGLRGAADRQRAEEEDV